jgi:hypothetical protein
LFDLVLVHWFALVVKFQLILRPSHSEDFEPVDLRHESRGASWEELRELLQENMRETGSEVRSVNVELLLSRDIDVLAARAVDFDSRGGEFLRHSNGQHIVAFTQNSWAITESAHHVLFFHHGESTRSEDESGVDQSVEIHG